MGKDSDVSVQSCHDIGGVKVRLECIPLIKSSCSRSECYGHQRLLHFSCTISRFTMQMEKMDRGSTRLDALPADVLLSCRRKCY